MCWNKYRPNGSNLKKRQSKVKVSLLTGQNLTYEILGFQRKFLSFHIFASFCLDILWFQKNCNQGKKCKSRGWLAQWKNVRFEKVSSRQTVVRIKSHRMPSLFHWRLNSHLMDDPKTLKYVRKNLATSIGIGIGTTVIEHTTYGQKGNVA